MKKSELMILAGSGGYFQNKYIIIGYQLFCFQAQIKMEKKE